MTQRCAKPLTKIEEILQGILTGNKRSIAKAITLIENATPESKKLIAKIYPHTGKAHIIGITGPSGSGKSTLIEKIVREYRQNGKKVGVIAVDPTSPFTGGAFLGDRIRMQELSTDAEVFIRSMATRNYPGGIARATKDAVKVLDASGKDVIIVETVGAGQSEVEIIMWRFPFALIPTYFKVPVKLNFSSSSLKLPHHLLHEFYPLMNRIIKFLLGFLHFLNCF